MNLKSYIVSKNGTVQLPFVVIVLCMLFFIYSMFFQSKEDVERFLGEEMYEYFTPSSSRIFTPSSSRTSTTPVSSLPLTPASSRISTTPKASRIVTPASSLSAPKASRIITPSSSLSEPAPSPFIVVSNHKAQNDMNKIYDTRYDWDSNKIAVQPQMDTMKTNTPPMKYKEHKPFVEKNSPGEIWSNFLEGFNFP